ncbi:hypothetical protein [Halorubrum saccharovorum]|uniref:hypothetical protein n=1 Tax=Halorubrum saccharovorum TaxID=2248 RepID=UPI00373AE344
MDRDVPRQFRVGTSLHRPGVRGRRRRRVALSGAIPAAIADGLPPIVRGVAVDDNLTIPPVAAGGMFLAAAVLA